MSQGNTVTPGGLVVTEPMDETTLASLRGIASCKVITSQEELEGLSDDELGRTIGVINRKLTLPDHLVERMPNLKIVARTGVGHDRSRVNAELLRSRRVWLSTNPGVNSTPVSEFVFGLMINLIRRINDADRSVKGGSWRPELFVGGELAGKTMGVVGFGNVGRKVCKMGLAFEMKVFAYDPLLSGEAIEAAGAKSTTLRNLLEVSDVVTLHVPLTPETLNLLDSTMLAHMKRTAILINTSRGGIVDEKALKDAIVERKIAGAALDVFRKEPLEADSGLRGLSNVVLTPHIAGSSREAYCSGAAKAVSEIARVISGGTPLNPVFTLGD